MDKEELIARFESEMAKVKRPGIDKLMDYIRKSDFYTAPASTKFHLSCESGLLQHSLNVLDALRGLLQEEQTNEDGTKEWFYTVAGTSVAQIKDESVILIALLHDICKTYFYSTSTRNAKNEKTKRLDEAEKYANEILPTARSKAFQTVQNAQGYKAETIAEAESEVAVFNAVYEKYQASPQVTRTRLLIETMERVLENSGRIIVAEPDSDVLKILNIGDEPAQQPNLTTAEGSV